MSGEGQAPGATSNRGQAPGAASGEGQTPGSWSGETPGRMDRIRRAAQGDDGAFRELVREVYPDLRRWALARTGHPDDADEVVQRTLLKAHRSLARFDGRARFSSWLYRILLNAATDLDRSRAGRPTVGAEALEGEPDAASSADPVRSLEARRLAAVVRDFTDRLPPRQREVLLLVDHQGLEPVEVAELLDAKPVTVRANLFKARKTLRRAILERHPELREGYET